MSGSVDEEVVRMRFDNNAFERGVAATLSTLTKLKNSLNFSGADKGLNDIEAKANKFSLQGMSNGIDGVSKKFLALATVGITALSNIVNRAVSAGLTFAKSFTVGPIIDGLHEYQTNLQSIQTIQSNTDQPLTKINASLDELNHYSDQTIYNFSEMAKNIGTFTAAGVDLKTATSSIKGIANLAALSGSSSQQAATAMYQLSQAISSGRVGLQDWNSVVNAGMGGKKLQTALATTAQAMGKLDKASIGTTGRMKTLTVNGKSFRESITAKPGEKPWLSSEVLVNTLATLDGRFSTTALRAELTASGVRKYTDSQIAARIATSRTALEQKNGVKYTDAQFKSLQKLSDSSFLAATQVKTLSQVFDVAKETIGSGWSASFKNVFGTFGEAKKTFTELSGTINGMINKNALARNTLLKSWHDMGGRAKLIYGIKDAFRALGSILTPLKEAFREIFPKKTATDLYNLTSRFRQFMHNLIIGPETADKLKRTFAGFFALLDIGKQIVGGIFHVFGMLFGSLTKGSGGFLGVTANIGDMIVAFDKALKSGDLLHNFFRVIGNVLSIPIHLFKIAATAIAQLFGGFHLKDASGMTDSVISAGAAMEHAAAVTKHLSDFLSGLSGKIKPAVDAVVHAFQRIGSAISEGLGSQSFGNILSGLQTGLLAGIVVLFKKFLSNGLNVDIGGGAIAKIGGMFDALTKKTKAMTQNVKADTLMKIAIAIGILTVSVVALSFIDSKRLAVALKAMAVGFGELLGAMAILSKLSGAAGFLKIPFIAASLNLLATAILLLAVAVKLLSTMSWEELKKGLTAVGILLAALSVSSVILSANSAGMIRAGIGITAMAVALNILYIAVKLFSTMSWSAMLKGLAGVGLALVGVAIAMRAMPKGMLAQSAAILLIATALNALYFAVKNFAKLSYGNMVKGLLGVAGALVAIAIGMKLMPPGMIAQAVALNAIALALHGIGKAVASMAKLSWSKIAKGLAGLGGALLIIAGGLRLMQGALGGAAALLIVAGALRIFVPVLVTLGKLSVGTIIQGLLALAASFAVIGIAGLLLTPVIPGLLALGVALGLVGVAMLAFGAGASLLGVGLTAIAASGGAAVAVLLSALGGLIKLLPQAAVAIATAVVSFITIIGKNAPKIIGAFVSLLNGLLRAVPKLMPSLVIAIGSIVIAILKVLVDNAPRIIAAGFALLLDFLKGIRDNIGKIVDVVAEIIIKFLHALGENIAKIIDAGAKFIVKFLNGIADAIDNHLPEVLKAGAKIGLAIVKGLWSGIGSLVGWIWDRIKGFFSGLWNKIKDFFGINSPSTLFASLGKNLIKGLWQGITGLAGWIKDLVVGFFKGVWNAIKGVFSGIFNFGKSIISGIWHGISSLGGWLKDKVTGLAKGAWNALKGAFSGVLSFGKGIISGIWGGISSLGGWLKDKVSGLAKGAWNVLKGGFTGMVNFGKSIISGIGHGASSAYGWLKDTVRGIARGAKNAITGGFLGVREIGGAVVGGLIEGVNQQSPFLQAALRHLAYTAVAAGKLALKIKSPSRVFAEIGKFVVLGLANGISNNSKIASESVRAMAETISNIPLALQNMDNLNPVISPVLDLTQVRKDATKINGLVATSPINATASYTQAKDISAYTTATTNQEVTPKTEVAGPTYKFEQNNYSPESLSTIDIYRQTNNQLSQAKRILGVPSVS